MKVVSTNQKSRQMMMSVSGRGKEETAQVSAVGYLVMIRGNFHLSP